LWALALLVAVILALSAALLWAWYHASTVELRARARAATPAAKPSVPASAANTPAMIQAPNPAPVAPAAAVSATNAPEATITPIVAAAAPLADPAAPPVQTYKLQSIFYRAQNPSAVINRQTVFLGSKVDGGRVTAIGRDSVTIVTSTGQRQVLDLAQ
jgi:hypothetical protein